MNILVSLVSLASAVNVVKASFFIGGNDIPHELTYDVNASVPKVMKWDDMLIEIKYAGKSDLTEHKLRNRLLYSYLDLENVNPKLAKAKADCHLKTALLEKRKLKMKYKAAEGDQADFYMNQSTQENPSMASYENELDEAVKKARQDYKNAVKISRPIRSAHSMYEKHRNVQKKKRANLRLVRRQAGIELLESSDSESFDSESGEN